MRGWIWLLFAGFLSTVLSDSECYLAPPLQGDRRKHKNKLRVVQYNVEWLFIDYYANSNCPGTGCTWVNSSEANIHLNTVADIIAKLNPDIVHLCEVEGCDELSILSDKLNGSGLVPYLKKGTDTSTGQNVGILTKVDPVKNINASLERVAYPIPGSNCGYTGAPGTSGVSKHQIVEFSSKFVLIGAHLLAYPTDPMRCAEREAQATVLLNIVDEYLAKGYEIIVIGDFNDYDGKVLDVNDHVPTSKVLEMLTSAGLYTVQEMIEKSARYSDWWDADVNCVSTLDEFSVIDHILVTTGIFEVIVDAFFYHGYDEYCGKYNSDHYPVVVDLEW